MNTAPWVSGKNILLVEDDPSVRQSIKLLLHIDRHTVTEAANGREALQLFTGSRYDLVITDYLMPEMLGDKLAQELRNLTPSQPILMVTAYPEKLAVAGKPADGVLAKPFGLDELRQAVGRPIKTTTSVDAGGSILSGEFWTSALGYQASAITHGLDESARRKPPVAWSPRPEPAVPDVEITPRDASEHVGTGKLTLWVQEQVGSLDGCAPSSRHSSTVEMLQLLTFAYACNVLASDEITVACRANPALRFICNGPPPSAHEITNFRRRHRAELELTLAGTLAKVVTRGQDQESSGRHKNFTEVARQRLDIARHLDTLD